MNWARDDEPLVNHMREHRRVDHDLVMFGGA
jgi:hypothetical protein